MKNIVFKTKFDECKNLNEIVKKIDDNFFTNISYKLLNLWIFYPLLMMLITYKFNSTISRNIMFYLLIFIGVIGLIVGILKIIKTKEKNIGIILGMLLLIWCLITSLFSNNYDLAFTGELYRKEGFETYLLYGGIFLLGILINDKNMKKLIKNLLFVEVVLGVIALVNNDITYKLMNNQMAYTAIFSSINHYGYYLMFGIILSIYMYLNSKKIYKILYLVVYIFLLHVLLLNDTFGSFISVSLTLFFIILYYLIKRKNIKELVFIIIGFILITSLTFKNNENICYKNFKSIFNDAKIVNKSLNNKNNVNQIDEIGSFRGELWKYGIKFIKQKPIIGHGIESTYILYSNNGIFQTRPHNILIQFGVFTGIPGIILYLSFVMSIIIKKLKNINKINELGLFCLGVVICYFISSQFGNSMFYTTPYYMIFLGFMSKNNKKELN